MFAGRLRLPWRSPHLEPGMRLGKYRVMRRLAVGGMAEIFLARVAGIRGFEKLVVIKRLQPQYVSNPNVVKMFLDEARLMATLNHPNITQVHDVGEARGSFFFAMEYVHGEDLRAIMRVSLQAGRDLLPLELGVGVIAEAAAGLHHAHEKRGGDGRPLSIVHRDVSPSNLLVSYDGAVKLTDFGVAKWSRQEAETRHGTLKGKCAYMSPEQCRGEPLDQRSDIFALGILLYELTTGTRLFQGASDFAILNQINSGHIVPPSHRRPGYPPALERIVMRALQRSREQRFSTARDIQLALESMAHEERYVNTPVMRARLMQQLFAQKLAAWKAAEEAGRSLGQHLLSLPEAEVFGYDAGTHGGTAESGGVGPKGRGRPAFPSETAERPGAMHADTVGTRPTGLVLPGGGLDSIGHAATMADTGGESAGPGAVARRRAALVAAGVVAVGGVVAWQLVLRPARRPGPGQVTGTLAGAPGRSTGRGPSVEPLPTPRELAAAPAEAPTEPPSAASAGAGGHVEATAAAPAATGTQRRGAPSRRGARGRAADSKVAQPAPAPPAAPVASDAKAAKPEAPKTTPKERVKIWDPDSVLLPK